MPIHDYVTIMFVYFTNPKTFCLFETDAHVNPIPDPADVISGGSASAVVGVADANFLDFFHSNMDQC